MNYSKKIKSNLWWLFVGAWLGLTPYIFYLAECERGYKALGGEIFFPLFPVLLWLIAKTIKNLLNDFRKELNSDEN